METREFAAATAAVIPQATYMWTVTSLSLSGNVLRVPARGNLAAVELLDTGSGVYLLSIGDRFSLPEYGDTEMEGREAVHLQLARARAYLEGRVTVTGGARGNAETATTWAFPDGFTITMNHNWLIRTVSRVLGTRISSSRSEP